jgi:hypothetical protein
MLRKMADDRRRGASPTGFRQNDEIMEVVCRGGHGQFAEERIQRWRLSVIPGMADDVGSDITTDIQDQAAFGVEP